MEEPLAGGNMSSVVRSGQTVRRAAGPWTETVHDLLRHVRGGGVDWVPEPLGRDEQGREVVSYLEGDVYPGELPEWVWADEVLASVARRMREFHDATAGFDLAGRVWQLDSHEPIEVVCHNDFAPYNFVFRGRRFAGVIDWDTASPGSRAWDVAYTAYRLVPVTSPLNPEVPATPPMERARRLALLCDAYGPDLVSPEDVVRILPLRLDAIREFTLRLASTAGAESPLWGNAERYDEDARYVERAASTFGRPT